MRQSKNNEDQSVNAIPSNWERFKHLCDKYGNEIVLVAAFMFFFYGGMAITDRSPFLSAFFAAFMTAAVISSAFRKRGE